MNFFDNELRNCYEKACFFVLVFLTMTLLFSCDTTANTESIDESLDTSKDIDESLDTSKENVTGIKNIDGGARNQPRDAKEIFWSDDNYCYVFPKVQSRNIYVNYKDKKRSQQMLKEALADGSITLSDLELFGFKFTKEPLGKYSDKKTVSDIVNLAFLYGFDLPDCEEVFYQDDENEYTFGQEMSDCIIVYYTDGTGEYLVDALESGHIKITDLDKFGIGYRKESKSK